MKLEKLIVSILIVNKSMINFANFWALTKNNINFISN